MKTLAYLRVSKLDQDTSNQKLAILVFAQRQRIEIDHFIDRIRILSKIPVDSAEANYLASKPFERYLCLGSVFRYYDA